MSKSTLRLSVLLSAALVAGSVSLSATPAGAEPIPLKGPGLTGIVPEVKSFTTGAGAQFALAPTTKIIVQEASLTDEAQLLADELVGLDLSRDLGMGAKPAVVTSGTPAAGDIVLRSGAVAGTKSQEAYQLVVDGYVTITGPADAGVFYGTRTLLQSLANAGGAQAGTVVDEPDVKVRSLHIDAARKFYSKEWFAEQIRQMSYVKLNQLQYHFSENEGYRLESTKYPKIVSSQYLTKAEFAELIALAGRHHIEVVPALDVPGHMRQALNAYPAWRASGTTEGQKILDYSKPEVRKFVTDLIDEYADLFPSKAWHLGGDEVFDLDSRTPIGERFPNLLAYAQQEVGPTATVMDGYVKYLNTVAEYLQSKGKTSVRAWNDALYTPGSSQALKADVDVAYWTRWHASFPTLETIKSKGHKLLNFNDAYLYFVLALPGGAYYDKPKADKIYNEWHPGVFPRTSTGAQTIPVTDPTLLGASYAIWSDRAEVMTEAQVASGIKSSLRAMASKSWNSTPKATYATWATNSNGIGDAPAAVELAKPGLDVSLGAVPDGTVERGAEQVWTAGLKNTGAGDARARLAVDFSELPAALSGLSTTLLGADGEAVGEPGRNVAQGRPVKASGQEVPGKWGPAMSVDGDLTTRFSSDESDTAWLTVELEKPTVIDHVTIAWELAAKRYKLQTSTDGSTWTDATAERTGTSDATERVTLNSAAPVSFVRLQALERTPAPNGTKYGVSLFEFQVWDGPETGAVIEPAVIDGTIVRWSGTLPAGHILRVSLNSTVAEDAAAGDFTVRATVSAPYFPEVDVASVKGSVKGVVTPPVSTPPVSTPPVKPSVKPGPVDVYSTPGLFFVNGRHWYTQCGKYSQTVRCRTEIWATTVNVVDGAFVQKTGWVFNNLTYLPQMTRAQWGKNPLANTGLFTSGGRTWRTECDTAVSGRNGCRSWIFGPLVRTVKAANGKVSYRVDNDWIFNNLVRFKTS